MGNQKTPITASIEAAHIKAHVDYVTDPSGARRFGGTDWLVDVPADASGVYCIFEGQKLVYVGETGNILERMRQLRETRHHTFRRSLGNQRFKNRPGFVRATSKQKFPVVFEAELNQLLRQRFRLKFSEVSLGRAEIEDQIIGLFDPAYNKRGRRPDAADVPGA